MSAAIGSLGAVPRCAVALVALCILTPFLEATEPLRLFRFGRTQPSPYDQRQQIIADLPLDRLTGEAKQRILSIA
ncbi:MAG: hypothetical protein ACON5J_08970, partial [Rubripirellula sp.]